MQYTMLNAMLSNWWYTMLYSNRRTRADPSRAASQPGTRKLVYANLFAIRQHRGLNSWIVGRVRTLDWLFAFINNASEFINNESAATRRSTWHTENSFRTMSATRVRCVRTAWAPVLRTRLTTFSSAVLLALCRPLYDSPRPRISSEVSSGIGRRCTGKFRQSNWI